MVSFRRTESEQRSNLKRETLSTHTCYLITLTLDFFISRIHITFSAPLVPWNGFYPKDCVGIFEILSVIRCSLAHVRVLFTPYSNIFRKLLLFGRTFHVSQKKKTKKIKKKNFFWRYLNLISGQHIQLTYIKQL